MTDIGHKTSNRQNPEKKEGKEDKKQVEGGARSSLCPVSPVLP